MAWLSRMLGGSRQTKYEAVPDEEAGDASPSRPYRRRSRTRLLLPRQRKAAAVLLCIDVLIVVTLVIVLEPLITLLRRNEDLFTPRLELHNVAAAPDVPGAKHKIPRILHQTTPNDTIPAKWVESQRSCKEVYKDYEYMLWTDKGAEEFLAANYSDFVESWKNYAFPIQRADAIRYFVLYHFGGIYLDMDTQCNQTFPMQEVENDSSNDVAIFKSTAPTGVTNDLMIASARHPAFTMAIAQLPYYYAWTRFWAEYGPYINIMLSSGPLFISLVVKDYLLTLPTTPSPTVKVISPPGLDGYITDLESSTWHRADAQTLMWLGTRPWTWFTLGAVGTFFGLCLINYLLLALYGFFARRVLSLSARLKEAKVA
ncbi:mannosyl phosphorylinositol ceramide synthase SUR1 [Cordyceps militaris CM01]|uniref:Mannosyl phosphorylinositol ceramide synthase SUR1 n=1 Tax=Cordyceps militaris (strain CM01) TaxID=983644 RepID=G3JTY0_CORMM|nr:mannosyl phosphorylinositol ceramide synthase SUR1 [Cordyceps militaris CM01]EGX88134.1 mannosyl phosphorylinositol ceramide synthase SUR1 [Cordyceps militaris CM01]